MDFIESEHILRFISYSPNTIILMINRARI
jgi:hypothetical protein